eukprot:Plantae.Rhodophyta-Purpureofilum_apyrenoidigerum.ctg29179.p1 GENE.Plantae.Rhodophyta-Purpureofilum_apyrenoidigerum.ctg29179~~Plantae.Rhodophyta-Purpureofilum_apyrenoidigerum.ctg29179.p1  ORF type:complete len:194 (-),score=51.82 Plantae.Rhodophyta-Purpureofilum_apyrenoidigerum.ctg29179:622-1203(-)
MFKRSVLVLFIVLLACHANAANLPRLRKYAIVRQISNVQPSVMNDASLTADNVDEALRVFLAHTVLLEGDVIRNGHVLDSSKKTSDMVVKAAIDNNLTICEQILALSSQAFKQFPKDEQERALKFVDNELDKLPRRMLLRLTNRLLTYRNAEKATMNKARTVFDSRSLFNYADQQLSRAVSELRSLTMDQYTM